MTSIDVQNIIYVTLCFFFLVDNYAQLFKNRNAVHFSCS